MCLQDNNSFLAKKCLSPDLELYQQTDELDSVNYCKIFGQILDINDPPVAVLLSSW